MLPEQEKITDPIANIISVITYLDNDGWEAFSHIQIEEREFEVPRRRPKQD